MAEQNEQQGKGAIMGVMAGLGGAIGIWAVMAFATGLASVNFQVTEMFCQFLMATNNIGEHQTLVDYYTHIKGVEYLMAGAFFVAFPAFFMFIDKTEKEVRAKSKIQ